MPRAGKGTTASNSKAKPMSRREKSLLVALLVVLVIVIACVSVFLLYPSLAGRPDWQILMSLDFNDSSWIEDMAYNRIKPTQKTLDMNSSFVYSKDTAYITSTYASSSSVADAKGYYLSQLPGSVDYEAGQTMRMNIVGEKNGEKYDITNYDADMFNAFDVKVTIDREKAAQIKQKLINEFPAQAVEGVPEFAGILAGEKLGGYIMYNDDELSSYSYAGHPIFSVAYRYAGTKEQLTDVQKTMAANYPDSIMFEDAHAVYIKNQGYIISLSIVESDQNYLAVITVQKIPA